MQVVIAVLLVEAAFVALAVATVNREYLVAGAVFAHKELTTDCKIVHIFPP